MFTKPQCMLGLMLDVGDGRREEALPQKLQVGVGQWAWEGRGVKGACESRPWVSLDQLGTGTSDPSPMLLDEISQCFQIMRSLVGCISGKAGGLEGRKWCLA